MSGFSKYDSRFETPQASLRHEVTPRMCATRRTTTCGSPPCSHRGIALYVLASPRPSCLLGADLISISCCSSSRGFARMFVSRCSFPGRRKEMTTESLHPFCVLSRRLETKLLASTLFLRHII